MEGVSSEKRLRTNERMGVRIVVILLWGKSDGYMRVYQNAFPLLMCLS